MLGCFDGGQVAEDDGALLVVGGVALVSAAVRASWAWGRCPALSWVLPLKAARRTGENQVNQSGEACSLPARQDRFGVLDQVQGLAGAAADRLALGLDGI